MANGVSKDPSFHTDFKNITLILVKSALKKCFSHKIVLPIKYSSQVPEKLFFGQHFFGCTFYEGQMYIFEVSMKRRFFMWVSKNNLFKEESMCTF
jgi:hypothetical protein